MQGSVGMCMACTPPGACVVCALHIPHIAYAALSDIRVRVHLAAHATCKRVAYRYGLQRYALRLDDRVDGGVLLHVAFALVGGVLSQRGVAMSTTRTFTWSICYAGARCPYILFLFESGRG